MIWFIVLGSKKNFSPVISLKMMYSRGQCFEKAIARPFASSNVSAASTKWKLLSSLRVKSEKASALIYIYVTKPPNTIFGLQSNVNTGKSAVTCV